MSEVGLMRYFLTTKPRGATRAAAFAATIAASLFLPNAADAEPAPAERIVISYVEPASRSFLPLLDLLREKRALERIRDVLLPIQWSRPLTIETKECDGDANAWYGKGKITVCYEYLAEMWSRASSPKRPKSVALEDAFVGPAMDVVMHEAGHALFDVLQIPVLGREEDAADQVAAYSVLQLPDDQKRRLVIGTAYSYGNALKVRNARDLYKPRLNVGRHVTFSDEHGTPAQRLFNLLCIAYGSDPKLFADVVAQGYLPKDRAEICQDEYHQVDFAYRTLIAPHRDQSQ
jgi:hypothetical protein